MTCGVNWTSRPGNSSDPPGTVPAYMAIIVSSIVSRLMRSKELRFHGLRWFVGCRVGFLSFFGFLGFGRGLGFLGLFV